MAAKEKEILQQVTARPAKAAPESAGAGGSRVPRHVAIIMDGNGRWAKARGLPRAAGHRQGAEAARKVLRAAGEAGVECLTLYAFSSENWRRPAGRDQRPDGASALLHLARAGRPPPGRRPPEDIGRSQGVPGRCCEAGRRRPWSAPRAIERMTLAIALNYGARAELVQAARRIAARAEAGEIAPGRRRRGDGRGRARHRRPAAARPPHPHLGRAAPVQLPALAGGLCRIAVRRHALARFRRRRAALRARRLCRRASAGSAADERARRRAASRTSSPASPRAW